MTIDITGLKPDRKTSLQGEFTLEDLDEEGNL